ncbi:MAG TPA: response regulator [Candidatus Tumulicola sp.]|nr:response regulator [Candidatus Tumulicola sp.]
MNDFDNIEILLVEDNHNDAEMTVRALKKNNFLNKLFWVQDGVEALDFIRCKGTYEIRNPHQVPKLILLDLKMPRLDGLDVLRDLKGDEKTRRIPIVVMTSSNQERDLVESYRLGVNGFITKPIQFGDLVDSVAKIGMYWLMVNMVPK